MDGLGEPQEPDLAYWRALAQARGDVVRALHEFDYWHSSTVARGEVVAGLEASVDAWRERCLQAEARLVELQSGRGTSPLGRLRAVVREAVLERLPGR